MFLTVGDLAPFKVIDSTKAAAMIADVEALAINAAPGLKEELDATQLATVKAILRAAVLRWDDAGSGGVQQQTAGPFGLTVDTRQGRYGQLWPSEESALQKIVAGTRGKAFTVDMVGAISSAHLPWCSQSLGATYCSCGADIADQPIYEA